MESEFLDSEQTTLISPTDNNVTGNELLGIAGNVITGVGLLTNSQEIQAAGAFVSAINGYFEAAESPGINDAPNEFSIQPSETSGTTTSAAIEGHEISHSSESWQDFQSQLNDFRDAGDIHPYNNQHLSDVLHNGHDLASQDFSLYDSLGGQEEFLHHDHTTTSYDYPSSGLA